MALVLAGGGESCADIEHLRFQEDLFGWVPSDSTVFRTFHELTDETRVSLETAIAEVRAKAWARSAATTGRGPVILDIDASLVEVHSEHKEAAAATFKGGFGFHPMFCFADATGETLAGLLRPGNAGANTVADHVEVLDRAVAQLPWDIARGHRVGDAPKLATRPLVVRADSAGCTEGFLAACRERNITFFVTARSNSQVTAAIFDAVGLEAVWEPSVDHDGSPRQGASVCELTSLIEDHRLPDGTRLVVRREPLHPGAQRSLFPSLEFRYWGFCTDATGTPAELDAIMRAHAHVEQHIARLKDSGLCRFPFTSFRSNANWMTTVTMAADLLRWFQLPCMDGALGRCTTQGDALWRPPRPRPACLERPPAHRADHRRLARHRDPPRRLSPHRHAHLTTASLRRSRHRLDDARPRTRRRPLSLIKMETAGSRRTHNRRLARSGDPIYAVNPDLGLLVNDWG